MGEEPGLEEDQVLVEFLPVFLLLCDQTTFGVVLSWIPWRVMVYMS